MIVRARHAVPAWMVPRGGRVARLGFVERAGAVRIPEVDAREIRTVDGQAGRVPLFEHDGRIWFRASGRGGIPLTAESLAAWLEGLDEADGQASFGNLLRRSPLLPASLDGAAAAARSADARILAVAPGYGSEEVGRWASENVLVGDGVVYLRFRPLLCFSPDGAGAARIETRLCTGDWLSRLPAGAASENPDRELPWFVFGTGMASDAIRFAAEGAGIRAASDALDHSDEGAEDAATQANVLPERVWAEARRVLGAHAREPIGDPGAAATVALRAEALLPHVLDGMAGCVGPAAAGAVLERCLTLSRAIQDFAGPLWSVTRLPMIDRYVNDHALPTLARPEAQGDLGALAVLAP